VKAAVRSGYRLIDCAAGYGNQAQIGTVLTEMFDAGEVARKDLFIVSKLFQTHHVWAGDDSRCFETLNTTLADLNIEYLDLLLIHWPFAFEEKVLEKPLGTKQPLRLPDGSPNPIWTIKMEYVATWKAMEAMVASGKVRSIGVSNFSVEQLTHLASIATVPIAVNQVELHPYLPQHRMVEYCKGASVTVMAYSPLGSGAGLSRYPEGGHKLMEHPAIVAIASAHSKSTAQVLVRWGLQRYDGTLVSIPKSSNPGRIAMNGEVFGWTLSQDEMSTIDALECGFRYFISYLKKPDNDIKWHDGNIENGDDTDYI